MAIGMIVGVLLPTDTAQQPRGFGELWVTKRYMAPRSAAAAGSACLVVPFVAMARHMSMVDP